MKLVTFNIRLDWGRDDNNNFCFRKPLILEKIAREKPDVICFQEVLPHVALWLKENLRDYYIVGCPRGADLRDEQACIAFRYDFFNLMKLDAFWLSPTPYVPGSRYEIQSPCPRICTCVTLHELSSNKVFRILNTHLDHEGKPARMLAIHQILEKIQDEHFLPGVPTILLGDLNAEPESDEIRYLEENSVMKNLTKDIGGTYHGYETVSPVQIDYIFASGITNYTDVRRWMDCDDGVYLSDHYPVSLEFYL